MSQDESNKWPLIEINGRKFYIKYGRDYSRTELRLDYSTPFNPQISFKMAQAVGYAYHPEVNLHFKENTISSAEEKIGVTLDEPPFNFSLDYTLGVFFPLHIRKWRYWKLFRRFGQSMVAGDIYRIFSNASDSSYPENISCDGKNIRWIDFGDSFSSSSFGYYWQHIQSYFQKVRKIWKSGGEGVLQRIQDIDDSSIEAIVNSVLFHPEVVRLADNAPIKTACGETLQSYAKKIIGFIKCRRDLMRILT